MKTPLTTLLLLLTLAVSSFGQSKSFNALHDKFAGRKDVVSVRTSGFIARTVTWLAGEEDFREALQEIRSVRLMVIPSAAFLQEDVSVSGFKKFARNDKFDMLMTVRDGSEYVTVMMREEKNENRYIILVEDRHEVVAMEVRGYIDHEKLFKDSRYVSFN